MACISFPGERLFNQMNRVTLNPIHQRLAQISLTEKELLHQNAEAAHVFQSLKISRLQHKETKHKLLSSRH